MSYSSQRRNVTNVAELTLLFVRPKGRLVPIVDNAVDVVFDYTYEELVDSGGQKFFVHPCGTQWTKDDYGEIRFS